MNKEFATRWIQSFSKSPEEGVSFYADEFDFADAPLEQRIVDDKAALSRVFAPYANSDPANGVGIHRFEVLEYIGDEHSGLIQWRWRATHAASLFGLPTGGKPVETTGMTFHVYRGGKIVREVTHSDQIHPVQQIGYPVEILHYWEEGFQPFQPPTA